MPNQISVQWLEQEPAIELSSVDELVQVLDHITLGANPEYPRIVIVEAHGYCVGLGLGSEESFVQFEPESGNPPYLVTAGDANAEGTVPFYLFGIHHTEILRRHLIPISIARQILLKWVQTEVRSKDVKWEEM
jgi:hypothetical protein